MNKLTIETVLSYPNETVNKSLINGKIIKDDNPLVNKLLLLKCLCIYLPLKEKEDLYSENFDELFMKYNGDYPQFKDLIVKKEHEYSFAIGTFMFLNEIKDPNDYFNIGLDSYNLDELYLSAHMSGIEIILSPDEIYNKLKVQLPTIEWQKQNMTITSTIDKEDKKLINRYIDYDSISMNNDLRKNPSKNAKLNDVINITNDLEKDIIVFRSISKPTEKIPKSGIFKSYGYLSTSFNPYLYSETIQKKPNAQILKIYIPKGKKAIYIPSHEYELIFPHNIELEIMSYSRKKFLNVDKKLQEIDFYEVKML